METPQWPVQLLTRAVWVRVECVLASEILAVGGTVQADFVLANENLAATGVVQAHCSDA
jgi:hypothetical protein